MGVIDLSASKTLQAGSAQYVGDGDLIAYDLSVTNAGNATATDVLLVDPLPVGTALDAARSPGWRWWVAIRVVVTGYSRAIDLSGIPVGTDG